MRIPWRRLVALVATIVVLCLSAPSAVWAQSTGDDSEDEDPPVTLEELQERGGEDNFCAQLLAAGEEPEAIVPDSCWGSVPSSHFDIGCDEGAWNHLSRKVYCVFTDLSFQGGRTSTAVGLWLVEWAYGFGIYDRLGEPLIAMADSFQTNLIGPLGLNHLVWFYAIAWAGFVGFRGRVAQAGSELVVSVLAALLAGFILANPAGYMQGVFDTMSAASGAVLAAGTGSELPDDPVAAQEMIGPLQSEMHRAFVEDPYDHLNWGGVDMPEQCRHVRDVVVAAGPHGTSDGPRQVMNLAGCEAQADFNHDPNSSRLFGAVLMMIAATVMLVLVALVALTVVVAQVICVLLFVIAPFAALAAVLPGSGRELGWRWLVALVRAVLAVVGMSAVLSLLLLSVQVLLSTTADVGMIERFALVNLAVVAMFVARRRIVTAGQQLAAKMGQAGSSTRGQAGWVTPAAAAGASGFGVAKALRDDDRPSASRRAAGTMVRTHQANRRSSKMAASSQRRADKASRQVTSRERSEVSTAPDGGVTVRRGVSVDGPAATTRRARRARAKVEQAAGRRLERDEPRWSQPGPTGEGGS